MRITWKSTEIVKTDKGYEYTIYSNNNVEVKCFSSKKKKEVEKDVHTTLKRMNGVKADNKNGIRQ